MATQSKASFLPLYQTWVKEWCSVSEAQADDSGLEPMRMSDVYYLFFKKGANFPTQDIRRAVIAFRKTFAAGEITLGGCAPPSCPDLNLLSESYDPRIPCECNGIQPTSRSFQTPATELGETTPCKAVKAMLDLTALLGRQKAQWNGHGIFTHEGLEQAAVELTLSNTEWQAPPTSCKGTKLAVPEVRAPDRRPNRQCDTPAIVHREMYPTPEKIKLSADAKYYFSIACGGGLCDNGIAHALADMGNDILIADYCEAADEEAIAILQRTGAAAVAFLCLCTKLGYLGDRELELAAASVLQFRALGYYRDHAVAAMPTGLCGSRQTGNIVHRHVDLGIMVGVIAASLGTGEQLSPEQYFDIVGAVSVLNDLVDFRSDAVRKQRENIVLRGIRGSLCQHLSSQIATCLENILGCIQSQRSSALVVMAFCNWCILASHHKIFELLHGVKENKPCAYAGIETYHKILVALELYGSLGAAGPCFDRTRWELDMLYIIHRQNSVDHTAWLADCARLLLHPNTLRRIVDVVHYEWNGATGDLNYCP